MTTFKIIAAYEKNTRMIGIEKNGKPGLPWPSNKTDMAHFRETTIGNPPKGKQNAVIMGRRTWESLPDRYRPLPDRINIVLTRNSQYTGAISKDGSVMKFLTLSAALGYCNFMDCIHDVFIIGGAVLYSEAIAMPQCTDLILTEITMSEEEIAETIPLANAFFPVVGDNWIRDLKNPSHYRNSYDNQSDEYQYLDVLRQIMRSGEEKLDRTGVGTLSTFGQTLRFNMQFDSTTDTVTFPLLTTKRMFHRGIVEELLFFLRGHVDNDILVAKNVHIWDGNTTREFLDSRGLGHMEPGSLGKAYGFQWRHWGAEWRGKNADYTGQGCDQIRTIIDQLRNDPFSRRIILSAWNVSELNEMCLPPCHTLYVFNVQMVRGQKRLFCHMTQRSGDMFLGVPFNIASTALLTIILAKTCGLVPGGIMLSIVDAHIYKTHYDQVARQLRDRTPYHFPKLRINKDLKTIEDIEALEFSDFELTDYKYHPGIKAQMAI